MAKGGVRIPILSEFRPQGIDKAIKEFQKLETTSQKIGFGLKKAFLPAAAILGGFTAAALPAIKAAASMGETINKAGELFGGAVSEVVKFADGAAVALGQSKQEALDAAATFATFGKAAGLTGTDLATFSVDLTKLASDIGSFNNTEPDVVVQALGSALRGESEPMRKFGVLLDDATLRARALEMGITDTIKNALTPQQKVLAAQAELFAQTATAQGDFERTSGSLANQQRILTAEFKDLQVEIGQVLLPIAEIFVGVLRTMIGFVSDNQKAFMILGGFVAGLAGAIVAANIVMKVHAGLQTIVKIANAAMGTSFQLTAAKMTTFAKGLGVVGAAIGVVTFLYQDHNKHKRATRDLTDSLIPLLQQEGSSFDAVAASQLESILASEKNQKALEALGLTSEQYFAFVKGEAVPALDAVEAATRKGVQGVIDLSKIYPKGAVEISNFGMELVRAKDALAEASASTVRATQVNKDLAPVVEVATMTLEEMTEAAKVVSEEMDVFRGRLRAAVDSTTAWRIALADAAKKGAESFNDFKVDSTTSIEEFRQSLLDSARKAYEWQNNLITVARTTSPEFARHLADMGLAGADLVAALAADEAEARRTMEAFAINAAVMERNVLAEFDSTAEGVARRMADIKTAVNDSLPAAASLREKAMAIGDAIHLGIVDALNAGEKNVAYAAAALADTAISSGKRAIQARSPSQKAADEIGRPIAEGVALGIDKGAYLAGDSITSMMDDVIAQGVDAAKDLVKTIEDEIGQIFSAIGARRSEERMLKRVGDAESDLADAKKNLAIITKGAGKDSAEYAKAQRDVQDAQWKLSDATDRHFDSQVRVNKAQQDVTAALNEFGFGSPQWAEAIRTLDRENRNLEQAARTVQDREGELTKARDTAASVLKGYSKDSLEYRDAVDQVTSAEQKLKDANFDLLDSQAKLIEKGPQFEDQFRKIATAAGLEGAEIDRLIQKHKDLGAARVGQAEAEQQAALIDQQTANIRAATPKAPAPTPTPTPVKPPVTARDFAPFFPVVTPPKPAAPRRSRAIGGPVFGLPGASTPIMAHGGEFVLSADVVSAIKRGAPSQGLGRGSKVAGGGNVINVTVTSADPQAVVEAIRRYNRTNGPAPFRVAS